MAFKEISVSDGQVIDFSACGEKAVSLSHSDDGTSQFDSTFTQSNANQLFNLDDIMA